MRGKLLVVEGIDGVGKETQVHALAERLRGRGLPVKAISFPLYGEPCTAPVEELLRDGGVLGPAREVTPRQAAMIFAVGMFGARRRLLDWLGSGAVVLCDRYVTTNAAYQAGRLDGHAREEMLVWLDRLHYEDFGMPRPDAVAILHAHPGSARDAVRQDAYDRDDDLQSRAARMYVRMAIDNADRVRLVPCYDDGRRLSPDEVTERLLAVLDPHLCPLL